jgi:4-carboxymuconolactone decarboxylase
MSRLTPKRPEELTPEQRERHAEVAKVRPARPDGQIGGPFDPWIRSPELSRRAMGLGDFIWQRTTLERRLIELAILVTGRTWRSNVEWVAHVRYALEFGVTQATIDDIFKERRPEGAPEDERLVYDVTRALHATRDLPLDLYRRAVARFGEQGLVELVAVIGFYTFVSMTLNTFDVPMPGVEQPFPRRIPLERRIGDLE